MLEKQTSIDRIEALPNGVVAIRFVNTILEDGVMLTQTLSNKYICPGDAFGQEDDRVKAICAAVHTPEVIMAYKAKQAESLTPGVI